MSPTRRRSGRPPTSSPGSWAASTPWLRTRGSRRDGAQVTEVTSADFRGVLGVNVLGVFHLVKAAVPHLAAASHPSVTIVGSDSGFVAVPGMLAYNASKGAFVQFRRAPSVELLDRHRIGVNSVCPSIVDTPMSRRGMEVESFEGVRLPDTQR